MAMRLVETSYCPTHWMMVTQPWGVNVHLCQYTSGRPRVDGVAEQVETSTATLSCCEFEISNSHVELIDTHKVPSEFACWEVSTLGCRTKLSKIHVK